MTTLADYDRWKAKRAEASIGAVQIVIGSSQTSPDEIAGDLNLASEFGKVTGNPVPPAPMVREYRNIFQQKLEEQRNKTILSGSPILTDWLRNPDNAAIARDDLETLSGFEKFKAEAGPKTLTADGAPSGAAYVGQSLVEVPKAVPGGAVSGVGTAMEGAGQLLTPVDPAVRQPLATSIAQAGTKTPEEIAALRTQIFQQGVVNPQIAQSILSDVLAGDMTPDEAMQALEPVFTPALKMASEALQSGGQSVQEYGEGILPAAPGMEDSLGRQVGSGLGSFLTVLGVGLATGGTGAAIFGGSQGAGEAAGRARKAGQDEDTQTIAALYGVFPGMTEAIPIERLLMNPATKAGIAGLLRAVGIQAATEGGQEAVQTVMQNWIAQNLYAPDQAMLQGVMDGFTTGGVVGGLVEAGRIGLNAMLPGRARGRQFIRDEQAAAGAVDTAQTIQNISAQSAASKLKARMPSTFRDYVSKALEGGNLSDLYVPADQFVTYFQGLGADPYAVVDELDGVTREDLDAAILSGGDLAVPTATYAATVAGSDLDQFFAENAKFNPLDMSAAQALEFNEHVEELRMEAWEAAETERVEAEEQRPVEEKLYDEFVSRLRVAGRSTDVATNEAVQLVEFYKTRAARNGDTLEDYVARFPVPKIQGAIPEGMQLKNVDELTRRLAEARSVKGVKQAKRGLSLLEFIDDHGGINDPGGELRAMGGETVARKGKKTLRLSRGLMDGVRDMFGSRSSGKKHGVDDVAQAAIEAGYLADDPVANEYRAAMAEGSEVPNIGQALWDAIANELRGEAQFVGQPDADNAPNEFDQIEQYLNEIGASLDDDDASIRQKIEEDQAGEARRYGQAERGNLFDDILRTAKERKALAANLASDGKPVRLLHADGRYAMAGPDMSKPGGFRLTRFDAGGPVGHTEHSSLEDAVLEGLRMHYVPRGYSQDQRGQIQFPAGGFGNGDTVIRLFENADLSTITHELGHYFLKVMQAEAASGMQHSAQEMEFVKSWWRENAADVARDGMRVMQDVKLTAADVIAALDNGTTGDMAKDAAIDIGMQEQWARGYEAYIMEGKAPSAELRGVFETMRTWVIAIYKRLAGLNVNINDDIRGVFDRMLATDEAIANAKSDAGEMRGVFTSAEQMGLTPDEFAALTKLRRQGEEAAKAALLGKTMEPERRKTEKWFKDERAKVREEVEREVNAYRQYRAYEWLGNGRWLGSDAPEGMPKVKLSKSILAKRYGEGVLATLRDGRKPVYSDEGVDPDEVADWFGFASGDELVQAIERAPKRTDAIEAETDRIMRERHGDVLRDGSIEAEAMAAVHNDKRGQWLAADLNATVEVAETGVGMTMKQARATAKTTVSRMRVRDAVKSERFLAAERKAAQDVTRYEKILAREKLWADAAARRLAGKARAAVRGHGTVDAVAPQIERVNASNENYNETVAKLIEAKRRRLINHALYMESRNVADEVEKAENYVARLNKKSAREHIAGAGRREDAKIDFLAAIDEILTRYDFKRMSGAAEARRGSLAAFIDQMKAEGRENELAIPDAVMADARSKPYKTIPVEELRGVIDSLKNLEHIASRWNKVITAKRKREEAELKVGIVGAIEANVKAKPKGWVPDNSWRGKGRDFVNRYNSSWQTATTILREMDGRKDLGAAYDALKADVDDASYTENEMRRDAADRIKELYSVYTLDEQRQMGVSRVRPELGGQSMSKWNLIAMALNMGNEGNLARLTNKKAPFSLTPEQVEAVKGALDERDWNFVQSVWDYIGSFKDQIAERERRVHGRDPAWVEATPVETPYGVKRGGYYPIKYAGHLGGGRENMGDTDAEILQSMMRGGFVSATTKDGHLQERKKNVDQALNLDVSVIGQHVGEVIHDLTFSEAVVNSFRLLTSADVKSAMYNAGMDAQHETLKLWLIDAASGQVAAGDILAKTATALRSGFTYSKLAFSFKTSLMQPLGVFQSAVAVGKKNMARSMVRYLANPAAMAEDVLTRSRVMRERREVFNKDIMDFVAQANIASPSRSKVRDALDDYVVPASFAMMKYTQYYAVDIPTWAAAFQKGLGQFDGDETRAADFADMTLNRTQGSGVWSDRSGIERGTLSMRSRQNPWATLLTTLGSYFFAKMNMIRERIQGFRAEPITLKSSFDFAADMTLLLAAESITVALISELFDDDDDDDDEGKSAVGEIAIDALITFAAGLPGIRDISGVAQGFGGGTYSAIIDAVWEPMRQIQQGEADKALWKSAINLAGLTGRVPSAQINRALDAAWREAEGEDVSVLEYFLGRPRK